MPPPDCRESRVPLNCPCRLKDASSRLDQPWERPVYGLAPRVELATYDYAQPTTSLNGRPAVRCVDTFWPGQCHACRRAYWSWDRWPRPQDVAAGLEAYRRRVPALFELPTVRDFRADWMSLHGAPPGR